MEDKLIQIQPQNENDQIKHSLHLVNCKIELENNETDNNFNVSKYFTPQLNYNNNKTIIVNGLPKGHLNASFRGRPLNGKQVKLPDQFTFAQVSKIKDSQNLLAANCTQEAIYWNLDKIPSSSDPIPLVQQWLKLSCDIHSHVQLD